MLDRRISHVVAIAHAGSFTKASQSVGISQSGITKSVADLEEELGFSLFHRTARGATLTEEGREFVDRAERLLDDARTLLAGKHQTRDVFAQTLRIGVCPSSLDLLLVEPLATLLHHHPSIRFDVVRSTFEHGAQLLRTGAIDVGVGFEEAFAEWGEFKCEHITTMNLSFFVRKGHPILALPEITSADLGRYNLVLPSDSRPYGPVIRAMLGQDGDWRRRLHVIDYFPIVTRIVETSDTIGLARRGFTSTTDFLKTFAHVPADHMLPQMRLCCATSVRREPGPAVRAFVQSVREAHSLSL
ncbi:LysR family transcriptional regulator [Sphingomonas naphthae]|uniref:LysR family transcriptional regulator n=1 Tax=Sphingomonas naphthae TaxID=1813468 RepID=A0ABY7TNI1_9SPHN|nr:LysR family transcriptional regulator [Sphingomonas naphthae]WCT74541.1 LysR family transcriptional regulator [Sphingomonas naphthae]